MSCCKKLLCGSCIVNSVKVEGQQSPHGPLTECELVLICPFCRCNTPLERLYRNKLLAKECPSHAKVVFEGRQAVATVVHLPDDDGRYDTAAATVQIFDLRAIEMVTGMLERARAVSRHSLDSRRRNRENLTLLRNIISGAVDVLAAE